VKRILFLQLLLAENEELDDNMSEALFFYVFQIVFSMLPIPFLMEAMSGRGISRNLSRPIGFFPVIVKDKPLPTRACKLLCCGG
jgi:hypothetical protein